MKLYRPRNNRICVARGVICDEVDPAELDLAALRVLGELKKELSKWKDRAEVDDYLDDLKTIKSVLKCIGRLESASDLKAVQLIQEKAKAWETDVREKPEVKDEKKI